jgi:PAS domain S-box-containing protein
MQDKVKDNLESELSKLKQTHEAQKSSMRNDTINKQLINHPMNENPERYNILLKNIPVGVYIYWVRANGHTEFEYVSDRWCEIHQISREEVISDISLANNLIHKDDIEEFLSLNKKSALEKKPFFWNGRFIIQGKLRWFSIESVPEVFDNGDIRWYGVTQDITKSKQNELVSAKLKNIMTQAEELANLGSWEWDIKNDDWILSENWKKIHGVDNTKLTTEKLLPIAHPEDRPAIKEAFDEALKTGKRYHIEHRIIRQDTGEIRHVSAKGITTFDAEGIPNFMVGTVQDITKSKQAKEALRKSEEKLRELNAQKDKFFSIIAHDLRSPFSATLGFSELILDLIKENDYEGIEEYAKIIHTSSKNAINLLMNLLEWARTQLGRIEYELKEFELATLANQVCAQLKDASDQKNITLKNTISTSLFVNADINMIGTVIRNLISNAIKFTHDGGEITISAQEKANEVIVAVKDTGLGISPERKEKLFRIDSNSSTIGTKNEKGTGIGLLLCKEFIDKHKGRIWVDSEPGKGSTFYFSISRMLKDKAN